MGRIFLFLEKIIPKDKKLFLGIKSGDAENDLRLSLTSRFGNALALSLQPRGLKTKNLLKQAWQIFLY